MGNASGGWGSYSRFRSSYEAKKTMRLKQVSSFLLIFLVATLVFTSSFTTQIVFAQGSGIERVHGNDRGTGGFGGSITVTNAYTPTSGNVLFMVVTTMDNLAYRTISSITQTNVAWTEQINKTATQSGIYQYIAICTGIVSASASSTITITLSGNTVYGGVADVCEYSGASSTINKNATNSGGSGASDTGTAASSSGLFVGGVLVGAWANALGNPTNGFSLLDGAIFNNGMACAYLEKIVSVAETANSGTNNLDNQPWVGCIATFLSSGETTPPTYSSVTSNTTVAGAVCNFGIQWADETGLATTGGYIFSTNNTGAWANDTWSAFNANPKVVNVTKTLNSTVGNIVSYKWFGNDTSNNWNSTSQQNITLTDGFAPTFSSYSSSTTAAGASCNLNVTVSDNNALSRYIYSTNNTGAWVNGSATVFSTNPQSIGSTVTLNGTVGVVVQWKVYANDTANLWGTSATQSLTISDASVPAFSSIVGNTTHVGSAVSYACSITDDVSVSGYKASWNNSGSWVNSTWTSGGSGILTGTLNSTVGYVVSVRFYANDSSNNWAASIITNFTLSTYAYTVSFASSDSSPTVGNSVTITLTIQRDSVAFTNYQANVTRDNVLFKENLTSASFDDSEYSSYTHVYNITALYDNEEATVASDVTVTPLTLVWTSTSGGGGGGGGESSTPTATPTSTPTESSLPQPDLSGTDVTNIGLVAVAVVLAIVIASVLTAIETQGNRRRPKRKGENYGLV
jgi:hypothetical protein